MNKTFVILGCHRSASSLVAKALHEAGVHMGDELLSGLADNPEGHFEDMDFLKKNVEILPKPEIFAWLQSNLWPK